MEQLKARLSSTLPLHHISSSSAETDSALLAGERGPAQSRPTPQCMPHMLQLGEALEKRQPSRFKSEARSSWTGKSPSGILVSDYVGLYRLSSAPETGRRKPLGVNATPVKWK